jgi:hypothetical protein
MSVHDGRILVASYYVSFSSTNLTTSYGTAVIASLGSNCRSVYIENTSGTPVDIAYGASGGPTLLDVSPINNNCVKPLLANKTWAIYLKSGGAASITTGAFLINFYN